MLSSDERAHGVGTASSGPAPRKHGGNGVVEQSPSAEVTHSVVWRKSSWSAYNGDCVEVAGLGSGLIGVRDSKDSAERAVLVVSSSVWQSFLDNIKSCSITS
jgi:Domain of unknown function (DUF397)